MARVVLVKTTDRMAGIQKAIDLAGIEPFQGKSVFIKANYNSADPAPASTHPDTLRSLVGKIRELGAGSITLGERSGMGNTHLALETMGVLALASELGFDTLVLDELENQDWVHFDMDGDHWSQGFYLPDALFQAGAVVQTCCLKTHRFGGHFTMSLKNSVGLVANSVPGISHNFMAELHNSIYQRDMIAEINLAYQPALIVLDGVKAFTSGGPDAGNLVEPGVILAGTDRVAMDAVGVAILRDFGVGGQVAQGKIFEQDQIRRAAELGIGVASPEKIELVTEDEASRSYADKLQPFLFD